MELSHHLALTNAEIELDWVPREENQDADDISTGVFSKFDLGKRVQVGIASSRVLNKMISVRKELYEELAKTKEKEKAEKAARMNDGGPH
eukprot:838903-Karenia_brevis.AAC.1